jgi:hypothetical protein
MIGIERQAAPANLRGLSTRGFVVEQAPNARTLVARREAFHEREQRRDHAVVAGSIDAAVHDERDFHAPFWVAEDSRA